MFDQLLNALPANHLPVMDHIAAVAMKHFRVPMSVIALNAGDEVVFVGSGGLPEDYVPKDTSFCRLVSAGAEVVVIQDTLKDERTWANAAVIGRPRIRFFAGAPLVSEAGQKLGTVCIADLVPRDLAYGQKVALKQMARIAAAEWMDRRSRAASAFAFEF